MRLCFHLPAPRRSSAVTYAEVLELAVTAEGLGVDAVCASDHPFPVVGPGSPGHHTYDPFVLLGQVAARTDRLIVVFSLLVAPYRNPFLTASMLATLAVSAPGRVVAGLGAGYLRPEFQALGASYDGRGSQVSATAAALRAAWTGEAVTLDGAGWSADGNTLRPVPTAPIPLWRGGNAPAAVRQAAADFDGWMPFEAGDEMASQAATSRTTMRDLGERIARFHEERETVRPGEPAEICFVRTHPRWLDDADRAAGQLAQQQELGVTWVESGTAGRSVAEVENDLHRFVSAARAAGVEEGPR